MTYFLSLYELAVMIRVVTMSLHVTMTDSKLIEFFMSPLLSVVSISTSQLMPQIIIHVVMSQPYQTYVDIN